MDEIKNKVNMFLTKFYNKTEISDDDDIFALGFVNSLFAMQLVMFIEKEFGLQISNQDLDLNNFKSINSITEFVISKSR